MSKIITTYQMLIASPSDTEEEVNRIKHIVDRFNRGHYEFDSQINASRWEDIFIDSNKHPQESVDKQILDTADFGIAIFRYRFGSPVDGYSSGTEKEIMEMHRSGKQIFIYFKKGAEGLNEDDSDAVEQYQQVRNLKKRLREKNIPTYDYTNCTDLAENFLDKLNQFYNHKLQKQEIQNLQKIQTLGISYVGLGKCPPELLDQKIRNAKLVKIFTTTGMSLFHDTDPFIRLLRNGGDIKILLCNPHSSFLNDVEQIERRNPKKNPIHKEFDHVMDNLAHIIDDARAMNGENIGNIYIGCAYTLLRQTETICIDADRKIWSWITFTMPPKRASGVSFSLGCESNTEEQSTTLANLADYNFEQSWKIAEKRGHALKFDAKKPIKCFFEEKSMF